MTFTVTYRAKDGALREERVEAASRAECVAECRRRGIAPTKIAEGGKGRAGEAGDSKRTTARWVAVAAVVVAAFAGGAWWWFGGRGMANLPTKHSDMGKTDVGRHPKAQPPRRHARPVQVSTTVTNQTPAGQGAASKTPGKLATAEDKFKDAKEIMDLEGEPKTPEQALYRKRLAAVSNRVFKTASDQLLAMAVASPGQAMPPLPTGAVSDAAFRRSLETPIEVSADDPPDVKALKEAVIETRAEMARMLAKGYTMKEVLAEHQKLAAENRDIRLKAQEELRKIAASGDVESARQYADSVNEALRQMGIEPISIGGDGKSSRRAAEALERYRAAKKGQKEKGNAK